MSVPPLSPERVVRSQGHDTRMLWRVVLALLVPVPWLAKGIQYVVLEKGFDHNADQITYDATHHAYAYLQWLDTLFVILVVPSILGMVLIARRGAPGLATAAALVMAGGFLMVLPLNIDADQLTWVAAQHHHDPALIGSFIDDAANDPRTGLGLVGFLVAIVIGSVLIALALWRSRAVAGWAAALVGLGGATHIFIGALGHVVHGAGLLVLAVGCLAVSHRLLTMSNDEFDLPPVSPSLPGAREPRGTPSSVAGTAAGGRTADLT